jgi:hypothetical protein
MWIYNNDYNKWFANEDSISTSDFDFLKQELRFTRFYSRCLSGATYLPVNDLTDVYDILGEYQERNWYISTVGSQYSITSIPSKSASPIDSTTSNDYYQRYLPEYGLTLKNLFTPYRLIKDSSKNFYYVDVATTEQINLSEITNNYYIDDVLLLNGHRVLVKDQKINVILLSTADPDTYFTGRYEVLQDLGATIEYQYSSEENGIYVYNNGSLTRETDLDDYSKCIRYSVSVKLGNININKQFHLSRLINGYFPTTSLAEPIEFREKHNWILRNRVDYNNLFEINYYDIIKHGTQSYVDNGVTYSIPERTISIGEFGVILNTQEGKSNIIQNKYKVNLRGISQTSNFYWICGDEGILLRVRKHDFNIFRVEVDCLCPRNIITTNLTSISFFSDLRGVAVGELNTILVTKDGGYHWDRIKIEDFNSYNYNKTLYSTNTSLYIAGNSGILIEMVESISGWTAYKRRVSQIEDAVDEYLLVENINDLYKSTLSSWNVNYGYYTQSIPSDKELLFLVTNNSKIVAYDINNSFSEIGTDFIYFDFDKEYGDVRNITQRKNTNIFYFTGTDLDTGDNGVFSFDISNFSILGTGSSLSNTAVGVNATYEYNGYPNEIFDYNGSELLICGNTSLLGYSTYSTITLNSLDSTFEDKLKSKMLVIDYDIASKLNFFTDAGEYRLPNSITFNNSTLASFNSQIGFKPIEHPLTSTNNGTYSETNWLTYWTDAQKTFEYYSLTPMDESKKVLISTTFSYNVNSSINIHSSSQITASASLISLLAPAIINSTQSRFNGFGQPSISGVPTTGLAGTYRIFLYDYLMVYKVPLLYPVSIGDVIRFESDLVDSEFIVNRIETIGSWKFIYMFTEFNQNIINDLQLTSSSITITNLNKYSTVSQLKNRFNIHPISNAYKLDYLDSNGDVTNTSSSLFQLSAKFNNITSYYNLQTSVDVSANSLITASVSNYSFSGGVSSSTTLLTSTYSFASGLSSSNTKLAGFGYGYAGDGGPAPIARLANPSGIRYNQNTNSYYIADTNNNVIRIVNGAGIIQTEVGFQSLTPGYGGDGGSYVNCQLYLPTDIDFDSLGNMYIATGCTSSNFHIIRKVDYSTGIIEAFAGTGTSGFSGDTSLAIAAQLDRPVAVAVNPLNDYIYICDSGNNRIRVVDNSGIIDTYAGDGTGAYGGDFGPAISAQLNNPSAIAFDIFGNLYIADKDNFAIRKVDYNTGIITTVAGNGTLGVPVDGDPAVGSPLGYTTGVVYDPIIDGIYIVSNDGAALSTIRKVDNGGNISTIINSPAVSGRLLDRIIMSEDGKDIIFSGNSYKVDRRSFDYSASLSGTLTSLPNNNDIVILRLGGTIYTYTFKTTPSLSTDVLISSTISGCLSNLSSVISSTPGIYSYILGVSSGGNSINISALSLFGANPNLSLDWNLEPTLSTIIGNSSASLSGLLNLIPSDGDSATLILGGVTTTYTFKNTPVNSNEIQISTLSNTLDNLLLGITTSYSSYLSSTSSVVTGDTINLISNISYGGIPNSNSNWTLSYNLAIGGNFTTTLYDMIYTSGFLKFGYSPTYNLLDYLTSINNINDVNPKFFANKEYLAMPQYEGLPLGSLTSDTVYIDTNGIVGSFDLNSQGNKITFGSGLKLEFDSIFINTFVDVIIHGSSDYITEKLLVMDKYYDSLNNAYVLEFHKRLNFNLGDSVIGNGGTLDIISRRYLYQISEDLQELNNIQKNKSKLNSWQDQGVYTYETYESELNFKIPTDSYTKILLSDSDTVQSLSAIIYVDYKNELAMNVTRLSKEYNIPISNTINFSNKLYISCSEKHDLITNDGVVLEFTGGDGSSQELNPQYSGYHVITKINDYDFLTEIDYGQVPTVGVDAGFVKYTKQDPFFNYQPVDLIDLGIDGKGKIAIELSVDNLTISDSVYSLTNVDFEKYRFRLIDGLNIETVNLQFAWLLEAELSDALIGLSVDNNLVWYKGIWIFGRWFGGIWLSGFWQAGDWYGGTWNSNIVIDNKLSATVDTQTTDFAQSFWYSGRWYDGTWNAGTWNNGRWYGGTWNNGMWHKGTWNDGTWNNGLFEGGIWVLGTWNNGIFNCNNEPAYWLDGSWNGGDFENGMWYNGYWEQKNASARFGTKSFNSRTANWQAGIWVSGSFFSYLNTNDQGLLDVSDTHKYSIWKTGQWLSGEWYGGIAYNMDFKTGTWYGGILEDIQIVGIDTVNNTFILNGIFKFNTGDTISVIDNQLNNSNSVYGSNLNPGTYKILYQVEDSVNERTIIYVATNLTGPNVTPAVDTGLRVVSKFNQLNWKSGIWTNGIYDSGLWEGGIWYNGIFNGVWS